MAPKRMNLYYVSDEVYPRQKQSSKDAHTVVRAINVNLNSPHTCKHNKLPWDTQFIEQLTDTNFPK